MTAIDGGGVLHDEPLPDGVRIRFRLGSLGQHDVTAYVVNDVLHIVGQYLPLSVTVIEVNHFEVQVKPLGGIGA